MVGVFKFANVAYYSRASDHTSMLGGGGGGEWSDGAMVLGKLPVPRRPTISIQ